MPFAQGGAQDLNVYSLDLQSADPAYLLLGYGYMPYFTGDAPQVGPPRGDSLHSQSAVTRTKAATLEYLHRVL